MNKDAEEIVATFVYKEKKTPLGYECDNCGANGIRLYRKYNSFLNHQKLTCRSCSIKDQGREPVLESEYWIGWLVAAVPTEDGTSFWGYTSVPQDGVEWWDGLPKIH